MSFDKHVFISYAHLDNQPLTPEQQGWVTRFHVCLKATLSQYMGIEPEIWRDPKLAGNDMFAEEIVRQFPKTAILVSVMTPRYVRSDWCSREVKEFCKAAEQSGGVVIDNKSRVIKVIKTPVESEDSLPSIVKQMLGYEFYVFVDDVPLALEPAYGQEMVLKYNLKLAQLSWDITRLLKRLEAPVSVQLAPSKPSIYLAECSYDRREARDALEAELGRQGYPILPDRRLPREEESDYVAEVARLLERCKLSIHLVGSKYGAVVDGPSQKSVVVLQNELAIQRSKSRGLQRVIWLPEGTKSPQSEQQRFIDALHEDSEAQFGAELITGDVETLKGAVYTVLKKLERPESEKPRRASALSDAKLVYLICDQRDRTATAPMRKLLGKRFDVQIPLFEGDVATVRRPTRTC